MTEISASAANSASSLPELGSEAQTSKSQASPGKTLFVGDSWTHGHFDPVRTYNSEHVNDLNAKGQAGDFDLEGVGGTGRSNNEPGPWGGIPGIFQQFADEQGLTSSTSMETVSATNLADNFTHESAKIGGDRYDNVVLQDKTNEGLDKATAAGTAQSELQIGASDIATLARKQSGNKAHVYLNENPNTPDTTARDNAAGAAADPNGFTPNSSSDITSQDHRNFSAAAANPNVKGEMTPVGDAFQRAIDEGVADPNPPAKIGKAKQAINGDETLQAKDGGNPNISADGKIQLYGEDGHHPSSAGAYLSALVQYGSITKVDPRTLGGNELAAQQLHLGDDTPGGTGPTSAEVAAKLQKVAAETLHAQGVELHQAPSA